MLRKIREHWFRIYFIFSLGMIVFAYGVAVGKYEVFPYTVILNAKRAAEDWLTGDHYKHYLGIRPEKFIFPARNGESGATTHLPGETYDGVTFITSMWDDTNGMRLIDMDGTVLHEWRVSLNGIWPESLHPDREKQVGDWDVEVHSAKLYPNGDVVFGFEDEGFVRIDRCSNVVWKLPVITHHSVHEDADGNLWVPGMELLNRSVERLPLLDPPIREEFLLKISPDGELLERTSILDVFYGSGQAALLNANGWWESRRIGGDLTHTNDIEVLDASIAGKFPLFEAGDIMVSMRNLNLIVVIDSHTRKIKWSMTGPYMRQHDPDFLDDGRILVYDNRSDFSGGEILGGSRILSVDPVSREVRTVYEGTGKDKFYTNMRGVQQLLPQGNILITEYEAGRLLEITPSGRIAWSYTNRYDEDEVYAVIDGTRLPYRYRKFTEEVQKCP